MSSRSGLDRPSSRATRSISGGTTENEDDHSRREAIRRADWIRKLALSAVWAELTSSSPESDDGQHNLAFNLQWLSRMAFFTAAFLAVPSGVDLPADHESHSLDQFIYIRLVLRNALNGWCSFFIAREVSDSLLSVMMPDASPALRTAITRMCMGTSVVSSSYASELLAWSRRLPSWRPTVTWRRASTQGNSSNSLPLAVECEEAHTTTTTATATATENPRRRS